MATSDIDLTVYPDECDAFGHLNQAAFLIHFERARWEMLARGPGIDVFTAAGSWPAVKKTVIEYHAQAYFGDVLRYHQDLVQLGRTSFTLRQTARRLRDEGLVATAELVFVCVNRDGTPVPVPDTARTFLRELGSPIAALERRAVNGVELAVQIQGEGPAFLLIHGYPLNHTIWREQVAQLSGWRCIAPDLRGMGQSEAPDQGYDMATYAHDLLALLDSLGVSESVLCGLSLGGYIAFELLRRARGRVRGLVLMDTTAEADSVEGKQARDAAALMAKENGAAAIADSMLPRMLAPATLAKRPEIVAGVREVMAATPVPGILGALSAMRDRPDSTPVLASLAGLPTLVVVGEADQITPPAVGRAMAAAIPGGRLALIPDAGHLPPVEQPGATTRVLAEFLRQLR